MFGRRERPIPEDAKKTLNEILELVESDVEFLRESVRALGRELVYHLKGEASDI